MYRASVIRQLGVVSYSRRPCGLQSRFLTLESSRRPPIDFISRTPTVKSSAPKPSNDNEGAISDAEWEIRVGRAISILTSTLPDFFKLGLVTRFDASASSSPFAFVEAVQPSPDLIYARHIRFRYAPPGDEGVMPKVLQIEGLPLYFTSAAIVRTSLNALYSDMHVALNSVEVSTLGARDREIKIGLIVSGSSRVGGGKAEWDILGTYRFSPRSGLINQHDVNSIHPAPHSTVYNAFQMSLQKLGLVMPRPVPRVEIKSHPST
ncbi:hypothetical protein RSOLAG1IB_09201 [Rhizoctonia solani AG-1 IB]|uniref:Uncharacterized protein n=1 Tax=Thanatephorus cucumeris (strain AG1-IB / isolate 7/3/14) TaxID=1108050 RepID=A0A0B7FUQ3_THACB|nr:hypothetical protein RSOLAG1IB_09201 [Rhizoctonia solani AG-1 IB]